MNTPNPREGWEEYAKQMHENGDDELLIPDVFPNDVDLEW
jgi:antitoxin MazE